MSLGATLSVMVVVVLIGLAMAMLAAFNTGLTREAVLGQEAFDGANSGLNYAMEELHRQAVWGTRPGDVLPETSIAASPSPADPVHFYVCFGGGAPADYPANLPVSVNNLASDTPASGPLDPVTGQPRIVPPHSALVFCEGVAGARGQAHTRTVEALLQYPPYGYAMAASQGIVAWNHVTGFLGTYTGVVTTVQGPTPDLPGNILALGAWQGMGVCLGLGSEVTGTVKTVQQTNVVVGDVSQPDPTGSPPIARAISTPGASDKVPALTQTFDTTARTLSLSVIDSMNSSRQMITLSGSWQIDATSRGQAGVSLGCTGDPTGQNGPPPVPLCLDHADLYVKGVLNIPGGIVGPNMGAGSGNINIWNKAPDFAFTKGADDYLYASNICIARVGNLGQSGFVGTGDRICIFADGDLQEEAVGQLGLVTWNEGVYPFYGTFFCHGNVCLNGRCEIHGAVVANGDNNYGGVIFVPWNCKIVYDPDVVQSSRISVPPDPSLPIKVVYWREVQ